MDPYEYRSFVTMETCVDMKKDSDKSTESEMKQRKYYHQRDFSHSMQDLSLALKS